MLEVKSGRGMEEKQMDNYPSGVLLVEEYLCDDGEHEKNRF